MAGQQVAGGSTVTIFGLGRVVHLSRLNASIVALALLTIGCHKYTPVQPEQAQACDDVRKMMIAEQKAKIAARQQPQCTDRGPKDPMKDPDSCFWKEYERQRQAWMANNPDPDQQRLNDLEGQAEPPKSARTQSAHERSCRKDIEADINLTAIIRADARGDGEKQ